MAISIQVTGDGLRHFQKLNEDLGATKTKAIYSRAINDAGRGAATDTGKALAAQANLPVRVGRRAVKKRTYSKPATLAFTIHLQGGAIQARYFKPREGRNGTTAAPRGQRQVFVGAFMRAGFFPNRVSKGNWAGRVFYKTGGPGGWIFEDAKTDVYIPTEATTGDTAATFEKANIRLDARVTHYLKRMANGAF